MKYQQMLRIPGVLCVVQGSQTVSSALVSAYRASASRRFTASVSPTETKKVHTSPKPAPGYDVPSRAAVVLADSDPKNHRPGDEGKIFKLSKDELKKIFPESLAGGLQKILFGRARPPPVKFRPHWMEMVLKEHPGIVVRKQAVQIMSSLHCWAIEGVKGGKPGISNPGLLLDGPPGTGKSTILNHCVHWARSRGDWIVVFVPSASYYVEGNGFFQREGENGEKILQASFAQELLEQMMQTNADKLAELPAEDFLKRDGAATVAEAIKQLSAKNIVQREAEAMRVFDGVFAALRAQTRFPLLVAIDEVNALHGPSKYRDLALQPLPARSVVIAETLGRFRDAGYARGVVVGAATRTGDYQHIPLPEFGSRKPIQVPGLTRAELEAHLTYMHAEGELFTPVTPGLVDYLMFVTAGRAREVERLTASEVFNLGQSNTPKKKLIGRWFNRNRGGYDGQFLPPNLVW